MEVMLDLILGLTILFVKDVVKNFTIFIINQNQITRNENTHGIIHLDARNCGVRIRNVLAWYASGIHSEWKR